MIRGGSRLASLPPSALGPVATLGKEKGDVPLPENESVDPDNIIKLRKNLRPGQVREGTF